MPISPFGVLGGLQSDPLVSVLAHAQNQVALDLFWASEKVQSVRSTGVAPRIVLTVSIECEHIVIAVECTRTRHGHQGSYRNEPKACHFSKSFAFLALSLTALAYNVLTLPDVGIHERLVEQPRRLDAPALKSVGLDDLCELLGQSRLESRAGV